MSNQPPEERPDPNETAVIQGFAERILQSLFIMKLSEETRMSIMTTAFINHVKKFLREAPPQDFQEAKIAISLMVENLLIQIKEMKHPSEANARQGEDGPDDAGQVGTTH